MQRNLDFLWICWRSSNVILNSLVLHGILILSQALNHAASTCTISVHFYMQLYNNVQYTEHLISYFCSQDFLYVIVIYCVVFLFTLSQEVAPPSPSREPVLLKSNLHKKGKRLRGWHQRYFEIQGTHMYYYKNQTVSNIIMVLISCGIKMLAPDLCHVRDWVHSSCVHLPVILLPKFGLLHWSEHLYPYK